MAPGGEEPVPKEQEEEDTEFWRLKSFAYNLEGNWRIGVIDASCVWWLHGTAPSHVGARRLPRTNDRFRYCYACKLQRTADFQFVRLNERVSGFVLCCTTQQEASMKYSSPFDTESVLF